MLPRANLPKEVMGYPDFPIPEGPESYLSRTQILDFLNAYCDHFALRSYIRVSVQNCKKMQRCKMPALNIVYILSELLLNINSRIIKYYCVGVSNIIILTCVDESYMAHNDYSFSSP